MIEKKVLTRDQTKEKALRILEFRDRSEYELRQKLKLSGAIEEDIDHAVSFCAQYGFLNDEKYACALARDLSTLKKFGKQRIKAELFHRGISAPLVEIALSEIEDDEDELQTLIEKKLKGNFDKKNCDKTIRYFIYRGYQAQDVKNAIERLKADEF